MRQYAAAFRWQQRIFRKCRQQVGVEMSVEISWGPLTSRQFLQERIGFRSHHVAGPSFL
jgi:hypothetical protein